MAEEDGNGWGRRGFHALAEKLPQRNQARASVQNNFMPANPHLHTRGIPAYPLAASPRDRIAAAYPPETHQKGFGRLERFPSKLFLSPLAGGAILFRMIAIHC